MIDSKKYQNRLQYTYMNQLFVFIRIFIVFALGASFGYAIAMYGV